jgi:hypothetical protein
MGFWKDVVYDMQRGMSKEQAIKLNATLKYGKPEEKKKAEAIAEADLKVDTMP